MVTVNSESPSVCWTVLKPLKVKSKRKLVARKLLIITDDNGCAGQRFGSTCVFERRVTVKHDVIDRRKVCAGWRILFFPKEKGKHIILWKITVCVRAYTCMFQSYNNTSSCVITSRIQSVRDKSTSTRNRAHFTEYTDSMGVSNFFSFFFFDCYRYVWLS